MVDLKEIQTWAKETFGRPKADGIGVFLKVRDEIDELEEELALPIDTDKVGIEIADIIITLCHLSSTWDLDIEALLNRKMEINRSRKWAVNELGSGQHIEEGE